jgi:crossover junction endodeoxyribonuclease RuvC
MGIDPGTTIMGYGVIMVREKKIELLTMGVLKLHQFSEQEDKLKRIFERTISLIEEYHPDELAIEAPFFGKNVQSMLKLGRAQGVAIAAALSRTIPIFEYSPRKIKNKAINNGPVKCFQGAGSPDVTKPAAVYPIATVPGCHRRPGSCCLSLLSE